MEPTSASQEASGAGSYSITATLGTSGGVEFSRATVADRSVELAAIASNDDAIASALNEYIATARGHGIAGLSEPALIDSDGARTLLVSGATAGGTLAALLERKRSTGATGFAPRAAANLVGKLCNVVGALHERGLVHGAINMETVRVDKAGNVHLAGFGLAPIAPLLAKSAPTPGTAPELAQGGAPSASTDLFAIGAVLYETLVGAPPERGCKRPSEVVEGLKPDVDKVIAAAMHPSVDRRPPNAEALRTVLAAALGNQSARMSAQQPAVAEPSLAESISSGAAPAAPRNSGQIAAALASDDEAWLVSKNRLDYGPFSMAKVFEMIRADEIEPGHVLINKHTGERAPVEEHPLLAELVDEAKAARDERRRAQAEVSHSKSEKRRGAALYGFIAAGVIGLGLGGYLIVNALSGDSKKEEASIGSLEEGDLQATISFPTQSKSGKGKRGGKRGTKRGTKGSTSSSGGGGNTEGWDDAVDLGDASEGGGDERLDDSQINPVVQRAGGRLGGCLRKNGGRTAAIRFIVKGSGRVSYVAVNGKTNTGLSKCIGSVMRSLKFPSFDGARTKANFTMSF